LSGALPINGLNGDVAVSGFELPTVWFPSVLSSGHRTQHPVQHPPSSIGGIFHREMENKSNGSTVPARPLLGSSDRPPGPSLTRFNWRYLAPWDGGKIQRSDDNEETDTLGLLVGMKIGRYEIAYRWARGPLQLADRHRETDTQRATQLTYFASPSSCLQRIVSQAFPGDSSIINSIRVLDCDFVLLLLIDFFSNCQVFLCGRATSNASAGIQLQVFLLM
jgi:hypothetical protein